MASCAGARLVDQEEKDVGDSTGGWGREIGSFPEMKREESGEGGASNYVKSRADSRVHSQDRLVIHCLYLTTAAGFVS